VREMRVVEERGVFLVVFTENKPHKYLLEEFMGLWGLWA
jgi:hypothetical protein